MELIQRPRPMHCLGKNQWRINMTRVLRAGQMVRFAATALVVMGGAKGLCEGIEHRVGEQSLPVHHASTNELPVARMSGERNPKQGKQGTANPLAGRDFEIEGLHLDMVWVEAGSFKMGSLRGEKNEQPVRTVRVTRGYWIGKTEVTQRQWRSIMNSNPSNRKGDAFPVDRVTWHQSIEFCNQLTEQERRRGRLPDGYAYRLPTEAEWEFAARGGTKAIDTVYAGSNDSKKVAWYDDNVDEDPHAVGTKAANELGIHDMSGNAWEWCHDWYQDSFAGLPDTDPIGPPSGSRRVSRGGGRLFDASYCRIAFRMPGSPSSRNIDQGFRVVLGLSLEHALEAE
jgi:formylglycine-generating enzyme required for sulfatase activity